MTAHRYLVLAIALAFASPVAAKGQKTLRPAKAKKTRINKQKARVKRTVKPKARARIGSKLTGLFRKRGPRATGRALEKKLSNPYSPTIQGQKRVWTVNSGGNKSKMTATVKRTKIEGKQLNAEIHYSNGSASWTAVTQTRAGEVMVSQVSKLGDRPAQGVTVYGVAVPRRLKVGKSWSNIVTQDNAGSSRQTEYKVVRAIRMKDPNGVMRKGFEVSVKDTSRVRVDGKVKNEVTSRGSYKVLEGVGMVHSKSTTNGVTVEHNLVAAE